MGELTRRITASFDARVRARGLEYFQRGAVRRLRVQPDGRVTAKVHGGQTYNVTLEIYLSSSTGSVLVDCDCPYVDGSGEPCKHIWATLLATEADPSFAALGRLPKHIMVDLLEGAWLETRDAGEAESAAYPGNDIAAPAQVRGLRLVPPDFRQPQPAAAAPKPKRPPNWVRELRARGSPDRLVPSAPFRDPTPLEPLYVVEPAASLAAGSLVLSISQQQRLKSGQLGAVKKLTLTPLDILRIPSPIDRTICLMLIGAGTPGAYGSFYDNYRYTSYGSESQWRIPAALYDELLPLLMRSDRLRLRGPAPNELVPLTWEPGEPWELAVAFVSTSRRDKYRLTPQLRRGTERCALDSLTGLIPGEPALLIRGQVITRTHAHHCESWLSQLARCDAIHFKSTELPTLLAEVARLPAVPPIEWPPEWNITQIDDLAPVPELRLQIDERQKRWQSEPAAAELRFRYDNVVAAPGDGGGEITDPDGRRLIRRQSNAEQRYLQRFFDLGGRQDDYYGLFVPRKRLTALVITLVGEGWQVTGNAARYRRPGKFQLSISSGIDWFDLHGQLDFDGQTAELPALLAAARRGEKFVRLDDGSLGVLPEDWLARHERWLALADVRSEGVRFAKTQLGLIDALLAALPEAQCDAALSAARARLPSFTGIQAHPEPPGFNGTLRAYQREGLGWLQFLHEFEWGGCLADDMGLGKTIQLLALIVARRHAGDSGPTLVVAPRSVIFNWAREAERFAPDLRVLDYTGLVRHTRREALPDCDLVLSTYGTLRRDIEFLSTVEFNYVVLDEAQAVKNPNSLSAKAARVLRARHRLVMTGTPVENDLGDLWSLFEFLNPGMLGTARAFRDALGIRRGVERDPQMLALLQRAVRPFLLRRTKDQVARELPPRSEQTIDCELGAQQRKYYNELRDHYRAALLARVEKTGVARNTMHVLEALLRLRQVACHPALLDPARKAAESAKLEALLPMLAELIAEGHKTLIFSQFTSLLALLREVLDRRGWAYEYLDGATRSRAVCVDRFQSDPACPLFLISLKAGGTGLNLTAADYVFILDPWWNPAVEAQAIDRTHRIGQTKKVVAYRLIARDTVESHILELQEQKRELAAALITADNSLVRNLTRDDLALLLS
jgi:superfamily II DNA or RNA helicase